MKALVFDVDVDEVVHLIPETKEDKEAYLGEPALGTAPSSGFW